MIALKKKKKKLGYFVTAFYPENKQHSKQDFYRDNAKCHKPKYRDKKKNTAFELQGLII